MDHNWAIKLRAKPGFVGRAEVIAEFEGLFEFAFLVSFVEHGGGFIVAKAGEGRQNVRELGGVAADDGQL